MSAEAKRAVTAGAVRAGMLARWSSQEWAIMWEVAPATGAVRGKVRYADAVMMSLWPSRGLELHGVEIKVSRSDWLRESKDPTKAERVAAYCDRWWLHAAPNVIQDLSEVPPAWGVREFDGKCWITRREADKTDAQPIDRAFLAALLRRADTDRRALVAAEAEAQMAAARAEINARIETEVALRSTRRSLRDRNFDDFEKATGIAVGDLDWRGPSASQLGAMVKAISASGAAASYGGLVDLAARLRNASHLLDSALEQCPIDLHYVATAASTRAAK